MIIPKSRNAHKFLIIETRQHGYIKLFSLSKKSNDVDHWFHNLAVAHKNYKSNIIHTSNKQIIDTADSKSDDDNLPSDIQCNICLGPLTNPVKNSIGNTYCYQCISNHYNTKISKSIQDVKKGEDAKEITDPKFNKALPQNLLLLIPDFEKLIKLYEYKTNKKIHTEDRDKLMKFNDYLNKYRKHLLQKPLEKDVHENMINIGLKGDGLFDKCNLKPIVDEIWRLFDLQDRIDQIIAMGVGFWNQSYGRSVHYEWKAPKFDTPPMKRNKDMANDIMQQYGIDDKFDVYGLQIDQFVADIMEIIAKNVNKQSHGSKETMVMEIKDKISTKILMKQQEIRKNYADGDDPENKNDNSEIIDKNVVKIDGEHQIWYRDNMACIREMMEFVKKGESFELIYDDKHGEITRDKLCAFLEFGGFNQPGKVQKILYQNMAEKLKYEILKISKKLQEKDDYKGKNTNYWRHVIKVESIKNPDRKRKEYRDYLWLKVKLGLNYEEELSKFDHGTGSKNAKMKLKSALKNQLAKHLGLTHKHYIKIHDLKSGSVIVFIGMAVLGLVFIAEKFYMGATIRNGR